MFPLVPDRRPGVPCLQAAYVALVHETFQKWFDQPKMDRPEYIDLSPEDLKVWRTMRAAPIKFQRFSDGLMIYVSLHEYESTSPCSGIFSVLGACATAILSSLGAKTPIRGGIDAGTGMEMNEDELYGPVVARAYKLESRFAKHPRIVVGDQFVHYLKSAVESPETGRKADFEKLMAQTCLDFLMVDIDGLTAIDFLGKGYKTHIAQSLNPMLVSMSYDYVVEQYNRHKENRDTKLAIRYAILLDYFESRKENWGL